MFVYDGALTEGDPTSLPKICSFSDMCVVFNCYYGNYPTKDYKQCISIGQVKSDDPAGIKHIYTGGDRSVEEVFINVGFSGGQPGINGIRFLSPTAPLYEKMNGAVPCSEECLNVGGCACTYIVDLAYNKTYQLVLTNYDKLDKRYAMTHHPMHLHGNSFAVVKMGFAQQNPDTGMITKANTDIQCLNDNCGKLNWVNKPTDMNFKNPPIKDNIIIPAHGYAVIQLHAMNPGYWLFHSNMISDATDGMAMIFAEVQDKIPDIPQNYPTCKSFQWTHSQFEKYLKDTPLNHPDGRMTELTPATTSPGKIPIPATRANNGVGSGNIDDPMQGTQVCKLILLILIKSCEAILSNGHSITVVGGWWAEKYVEPLSHDWH